MRNETARLVLFVVETMGPDRIIKEIPEKVLPVAAKFIQDGSAETRYTVFTNLYWFELAGADNNCALNVLLHVGNQPCARS